MAKLSKFLIEFNYNALSLLQNKLLFIAKKDKILINTKQIQDIIIEFNLHIIFFISYKDFKNKN